jgi:hypothetical protein
MRTAHQIKSDSSGNPDQGPSDMSLATIRSGSQLKGRFRLSTTPKTNKGRSALNIAREAEIDSLVDDKISFAARARQGWNGPYGKYGAPGSILPQTMIDLRQVLSVDNIQWFQNNTVDPFQTLPAASNWRVETLIRYCGHTVRLGVFLNINVASQVFRTSS